jgi:hypothetical protein
MLLLPAATGIVAARLFSIFAVWFLREHVTSDGCDRPAVNLTFREVCGS